MTAVEDVVMVLVLLLLLLLIVVLVLVLVFGVVAKVVGPRYGVEA